MTLFFVLHVIYVATCLTLSQPLLLLTKFFCSIVMDLRFVVAARLCHSFSDAGQCFVSQSSGQKLATTQTDRLVHLLLLFALLTECHAIVSNVELACNNVAILIQCCPFFVVCSLQRKDIKRTTTEHESVNEF